MSSDEKYDKEVFDQVLSAIRGSNPSHKEATDKEKARARKVVESQTKHLRKKYNNKHKGGDYSIDTGMFD